MNGGNGHGEQLSTRFEKALAALLETSTFGEAAARVGVSESTLRRWAQQPEFAAAYQQARRQILEAALAGLSAAAGKAVQTLVRLLDGDSPNAAVRAAGLILDHAERGAELLDLNARLEQLEALLPGDGDRPRGRPPKDASDRLSRLEARSPFGGGCAVCTDVDRLAQALADAKRDGQPVLEGRCPQCGGELGDIELQALLRSLRPEVAVN